MKKVKKRKIVRKKHPVTKLLGKIDRGTIFVVVIVITLLFTGYIFVGGNIPQTIPKPRTSGIVSVSLPASYPTGRSLQMHTFIGPTITPFPTEVPHMVVPQTKPVQDALCKTPKGNIKYEMIWTSRISATPASGNAESLQVFYSYSKPMLLGTGTVTAMKTGPADHAANPNVGNTNIRDVNQYPYSPALFLTDITTNPDDTSGDAENGGVPQSPSDVYGAWKGRGAADPTAPNGTNLGAGGDPWPPASGVGGGTDTTWTAQIIWKVTDLRLNGQPLIAGHKYRVQYVLHAGDDTAAIGQECFTFTF